MICHMLMIFFVETDVFAFVSCSLYCFYVQFAIVVFRFWSLHKPHPPLPFPFLFKFLLTYNYVSIKCLKSPALLFQVFAYLQLLWNFHQVSKNPQLSVAIQRANELFPWLAGTAIWSTYPWDRCCKCKRTWGLSHKWVHVCGKYSLVWDLPLFIKHPLLWIRLWLDVRRSCFWNSKLPSFHFITLNLSD